MENFAFSLVAIAFLALCCFGASHATLVVKEGKCPDVQGQPALKFELFLGTWYEYMRFPTPFTIGLDCVSLKYENTGSNTMGMTTQGYLRVNIFERDFIIKREQVVTNATVPNPEKPAELHVTFNGATVDFTRGRANYYILGTDYSTFAIIFSCEQIKDFNSNIQFAWILTRERGVAPEQLERLQRRMAEAEIDVSKFQLVDQSDCPE